MAANPIEVTDAVKRYGRVRALDGLELSVRTGEVHGFLALAGCAVALFRRRDIG